MFYEQADFHGKDAATASAQALVKKRSAGVTPQIAVITSTHRPSG
jgi:hypothetical protein